MKKIVLMLFFFVFVTLFLSIGICSIGGDSIALSPYDISVIYIYNDSVSAVDITKTSDFSGTDDVLIVAAKDEKGKIVRVHSTTLQDNLPAGITEIKIPDFPLSENQTVFVTVWDDLDSLKPLTDGTIPTPTIEPERVIGNEEEWLVSQNGKRIYSYIGDDTNVVIPNYIGGKHITIVAPASSAENMVSIFGDKATDITSFRISEGIKKIGPTAFYKCINATNELILPSTLDYIGAYAFCFCEKMTGNLVIPEGVEDIYPFSFSLCKGLSSLTLPDSLNSVGSYSFYGCSGISGELKISESISRIEDYAFGNCGKITGSLSLPGVVHIGNGAFSACYGLNGNLTFSDNLQYIGSCAFEHCSFNGILTFPDSLVHIGDAAFNHCKYFDNEILIIPENVETLGGDRNVSDNTCYSSHLFYDFCTKNKIKAYGVAPDNKNFKANDGVLYNLSMTRLIAYPFGKDNERFEIPEGVTQIDEMAFGNSFSLKELILPDSYVIEKRAPSNVINQNGNTLAVALYYYSGIEKILVKDTNPNYISINGALYSKDGKTLWYCPIKGGSSYTVESGTERIETGAIYGIKDQALISSFKIPASVSYIAPETLSTINTLFSGKISVDKNNTSYSVVDGKLKAVK